jgi:inner membrane protein
MFALGHLGIGKKLAARPFRGFSRADRRAFFVGALLPDLIDKPLYYIPAWLTGKDAAAAGILSGTHLFAHTGLFLVVLAGVALVTRSGPARALVIGVATHFVLDFVGLSMNWATLLWPFLGWQFPTYPFRSLGQHLGTIFNPITFIGETLGAAILWSDYRKHRKSRRPAVPGAAP